MTFVYPAVFTPKKDGKGYDAYFPDLECCEAEGPDLEDAVENAREAAYNWISLELEEEGDLPAQTHIDDMSLPEGSMVKQIMVRIKLLPDNDWHRRERLESQKSVAGEEQGRTRKDS